MLCIRKRLRDAALKETTVPRMELIFSLGGGPVLETFTTPTWSCPLFEPLWAVELSSMPIGVELPRKRGAIARHAKGHFWGTAVAVVAAPATEPTLDPVCFIASGAVLQVAGFQPMHNFRRNEAAAPAVKVRAFFTDPRR